MIGHGSTAEQCAACGEHWTEVAGLCIDCGHPFREGADLCLQVARLRDDGYMASPLADALLETIHATTAAA